jgi:hypothetical protein
MEVLASKRIGITRFTYGEHMEQALGALRSYRAEGSELKRGDIPSPEDEGIIYLTLGYLIVSVIAGAILGGILWPIISHHKPGGFWHGLYLGGVAGFWICGLWPLLRAITSTIMHFRLPRPGFLATFHPGQKFLCVLLVSWTLAAGIDLAYPTLAYHWETKTWPGLTTQFPALAHTGVSVGEGAKAEGSRAQDKRRTVTEHKNTPATRQHGNRQNHQEGTKKALSPDTHPDTMPNYIGFLLWLFLAVFLRYTVNKVGAYRTKRYHAKAAKAKPIVDVSRAPFRLWLGESTGTLSSMSHGAGIAPRQDVTLSLADACQNMLVLGAIGSGKTTRAMHPLLMQLLDQPCGGLIFDVKADFERAVQAMAKTVGKSITVIGVGHHGINLLAGLTPEIAASFLKSVFLLNGKHSGDSFWVETATELCRNVLGLLSFLPEYYHLQGLYRYIFEASYQSMIDDAIHALRPTLSEKARLHVDAYANYQSQIFDKFDDKVQASVNATVAQVLSPFNHPDLIEA